MTTAAITFTLDLSTMTGPPGPVAHPADCPGFGQELSVGWKCPATCPIKNQCFEAYEREEPKK